jgi:hypothetical protein
VILLIDLAQRPFGLVRERRLLGIQFEFLDRLARSASVSLGRFAITSAIIAGYFAIILFFLCILFL